MGFADDSEAERQSTASASPVEALPLETVKRAPPGSRAKSKKRHRLLLVIAGLLALGVVAMIALRPGGGSLAPAAGMPIVVVGIGRILPQSDVIIIAPPYGASGARVASVEIVEGQTVKAGHILARLDNEALRTAAAESAAALVLIRQAQLEQTRVTTAAARAEAQASFARAQTSLATIERDLRRVETLAARGAATVAALDRNRAARDEARRDVERATATLTRFGTAPDTAPDIEVAQQALAQAQAEAARAKQEREQALVRAPIDATVLSVDIRPGEAVGARDMMMLGDLEKMRVEAEIYETERQSVRAGALVTVTSRALPQPLHGRVAEIGRAVKRQAMIGETPAAATDARIFEVRIDLDNASSVIARDFSNLQVTAKIEALVAP